MSCILCDKTTEITFSDYKSHKTHQLCKIHYLKYQLDNDTILTIPSWIDKELTNMIKSQKRLK